MCGGRIGPDKPRVFEKWCHRHGVLAQIGLHSRSGGTGPDHVSPFCPKCDAMEQAMLLLMDAVNAGGDAVLLSHAVWHMWRVNDDFESVERWAAGMNKRWELSHA